MQISHGTYTEMTDIGSQPVALLHLQLPLKDHLGSGALGGLILGDGVAQGAGIPALFSLAD